MGWAGNPHGAGLLMELSEKRKDPTRVHGLLWLFVQRIKHAQQLLDDPWQKNPAAERVYPLGAHEPSRVSSALRHYNESFGGSVM